MKKFKLRAIFSTVIEHGYYYPRSGVTLGATSHDMQRALVQAFREGVIPYNAMVQAKKAIEAKFNGLFSLDYWLMQNTWRKYLPFFFRRLTISYRTRLNFYLNFK